MGHQSSFNPNMPIPKCVCFYNGRDKQPEGLVLSSSDAFKQESDNEDNNKYIEGAVDADIEVKVRMLNIYYGKNKKLMEACEPLIEYAWLLDKIRSNEHDVKSIENAVDMLKKRLPLDLIAEISKLSEDVIRGIASLLDLAVV